MFTPEDLLQLKEMGLSEEAVSYTHLDVYKRQADGSDNREIGHFEKDACHNVGYGKHDHETEITGKLGDGAPIAVTGADYF